MYFEGEVFIVAQTVDITATERKARLIADYFLAAFYHSGRGGSLHHPARKDLLLGAA